MCWYSGWGVKMLRCSQSLKLIIFQSSKSIWYLEHHSGSPILNWNILIKICNNQGTTFIVYHNWLQPVSNHQGDAFWKGKSSKWQRMKIMGAPSACWQTSPNACAWSSKYHNSQQNCSQTNLLCNTTSILGPGLSHSEVYKFWVKKRSHLSINHYFRGFQTKTYQHQ